MAEKNDPFRLERFLEAQEPVYEQVCKELREGRKRSHWIWFIFPQRKGLGRSATSEFYGIGSMEEARAYLAHPVLGQRLRECTRAVNAVEGRTAEAEGDAEAAAEFRAALDKYFGGAEDPRTAEWMG